MLRRARLFEKSWSEPSAGLISGEPLWSMTVRLEAQKSSSQDHHSGLGSVSMQAFNRDRRIRAGCEADYLSLFHK